MKRIFHISFITKIFFALSLTILILCVQIYAADSQLGTSLDKGDVEGVRAALKAGADPNERQSEGMKRSAIDRATLLVIHGDTCDQSAENITLEILKLLLDSGAVIKKHDSGILVGPVIKGCNNLVQFLIDKGADVNGKEVGLEDEPTPLFFAYEYDHPETANILLSHGAKPLPQAAWIQSAFVMAARDGHISKLQKFLQQGAIVDGINRRGETALIASIGVGEPNEAFEWLLKNGANPNLNAKFSFFKQSPLSVAVCPNFRVRDRIIKTLLQYGARVSAADSDLSFQRTPLHWAAWCHNDRAVKILIDEGAKVMPRDKDGKTPLDLAQDGEIIKLLKSAGAVEQLQ